MSLDRSTVRRDCVVFAAVLLALTTAALAQGGEGETNRKGDDPAAVARWRQMRFGMFIHWGPVSLKGTEISWSRGYQVPIDEYDNLYKRFNPAKFEAGSGSRRRKTAGMKYIVLTTKHHDGFCLWDTKQTDYNIMHTPFDRDVIKELAERVPESRDSILRTLLLDCDWRHPDSPSGMPDRAEGVGQKPHPNLDRYEQYLRKQVEELIAQLWAASDDMVRHAPVVRRQARPGSDRFCSILAA